MRNGTPFTSRDAANILDAVPEAYVRLDSEFRHTFVNRAAERLLGKDRADLLGNVPWDVYPALAGTSFEENCRRAMADRIPLEFEDYFASWQRWHAITVTPDVDGGLVVRTVDITKRKWAEEALSASEARYRRLFETAKDGILILDAETGMIEDVNPFLVELLGFSHEEFVGKELWELGFFKDIVANQAHFAELREKEYVRYENMPLETADGRRREVEFVSNVYLVGDKNVIQCNIRHITDRKRAEEALRESEEKFRSIAERSPDLIALTDVEGVIVYASPACMRLFHAKPEEMIGCHFTQFLDESAVSTAMAAFRKGTEHGWNSANLELRMKRKDGSTFVGELTGPLSYSSLHRGTMVTIRDITERKQAEEALNRQLRLSSLLLDSMPCVALLLEPRTRRIVASNEAGVRVGAVPGRTCFEAWAKRQTPCPWCLAPRVWTEGTPQRCEPEHQGISYEAHWVPVSDDLYLHYAFDITERKRAENALRESEERFRVVATNTPDHILVQDKELRYEWVINPQLGLTVEGMVGRTDFDILPAEDADRLTKIKRDVLESGMPIHVSLPLVSLQRDTQYFDGTYTPRHDSAGGIDGLIGYVRNVTERKRAEEVLRESEDRYRNLFDQSGDSILLLEQGDGPPLIRDANQAALRAHGYSREEMVGQPISLLEPDVTPEAVEERHRLLAEGKPMYMRRRRKDGSMFDVESVSRWARIGAHDVVLTVERDITERKQAEAALRRAKEAAEAGARAKSEFLSSMSHEIRTPMNGVIGMTGLLLDTPLTPEQQGYAEIVRSSCEALLGIINNILDFSKLEAGKLDLVLVPFDLHEVLEDVVELLAVEAREKDLKLIFRYAPEAPREFLGDPGRIRQVALNLVGNAIKFTERGHVLVEVGSRAISEGLACVRIAVRDTGMGIPADRQGMLFQKFQQLDSSTTRKHGGTGLGLAISKQLVELMDGTLSLSSQVGEGSTFSIELPLRAHSLPREGRKEEECKEPSAPRSFAGRRVLLVEDNIVSQKLGAALLDKLGCGVDVAANGREALAMTSRLYDLIFMDCQMPEMDGYQATGEIRKREGVGRHTPIIALTAGTTAGDRERCLRAGMDDFLSKPFQAEQLREMLDKHLPNPARPDRRRANGEPD